MNDSIIFSGPVQVRFGFHGKPNMICVNCLPTGGMPISDEALTSFLGAICGGHSGEGWEAYFCDSGFECGTVPDGVEVTLVLGDGESPGEERCTTALVTWPEVGILARDLAPELAARLYRSHRDAR